MSFPRRGTLIRMSRHASAHQRHIAPINRNQQSYYASPMAMYEQNQGQEGWVSEHPWMTFFLALAGLSVVATVIEVVAFSSAVKTLSTQPPA